MSAEPEGIPRLDRIALRGLRGFGHHGVFDHERREGQEFAVDVVLGVDTRAAARSDSVTDTVHYGVLSDHLVQVVEGDPVNLIETLADRLAEVCLAHPLVSEVEVTVHKPNAPIAHPFDDVTVTILRRR
ncbi:dihydroneopterin aldolase [Murinocardiopsis flavida]|uniref:7,8-dihydroneopterin aldolase n=1 Tax=Murinocardiopsis flavida TaxID=645275 RepID=A0A2P8D106_9ACTN|nr:dihydroneopterin aldolase [Murinocardiopsis flavida]PSK90899.1 dihydroneopterin aldolase [Murinocardiopsis flavida]